jgi:hypothetical protein
MGLTDVEAIPIEPSLPLTDIQAIALIPGLVAHDVRNNMKRFTPFMLTIVVFLIGCHRESVEIKRPIETANAMTSGPKISQDTAILIAKGDSCGNYAFEKYDVHVYDEQNAWHLVFELKDTGMHGGGPDYLIDKETGKILRVTYYK